MKKRFFISGLIFLLIFCVLGIPFTQWWFYGADDAHALFLAYKTKTWKDLFYFFYEGYVGQDAGPSNYVQLTGRTPFLHVYYRPLYLIFHALEYWVYGLNGYYYHLTAVFFHAANATILFNIFLFFTGYLPAMLASMLFAFHPQIAYRFGAMVNLHYYINVFLFLLLFLVFKHFLDTKKIIFNILACVFFACSLFTRETTIILPGLLFLGTYLYVHEKKYLSLKHFFHNFFKTFMTTLGFWIVAILFLAWRLFLYPLALSKFAKTFSLISTLKTKFPEFKVFMFDFLALSWFPWGRPFLRATVLVSLILFLFYFFIKNTQKIYVLYFLFCAAIILWPASMGPYSPRYFYEAYPFILCALVILFAYHKKNIFWIKNIGLTFLGIMVVGYATFCFDSFVRREKKMHVISRAAHEFVANPEVQGRPLCFVGWPSESFGAQCAPLFWVLFDNPDLPVYCDSATAIMQADSNVVMPTKWGNIISEFYNKNYVDIVRVPGGVRMTSYDPEKVFFVVDGKGYFVGKKIIHKKAVLDGHTVTTDFTLLVDQKYFHKDLLFVRWDYESKKFVVIS